MKYIFATIAAAALLWGGKIPRHERAVVLFDGTSLDNFDTFIRDRGLNNDPEHVFRIENGVIHVSGKEFGYIVTKREFANYYLTAEFKWGEGTYAERAGHGRDSGILYHIVGEQKVWPKSLEFQIMEGMTGDIIMTDDAKVTPTKPRSPSKDDKWLIPHYGKGEFKDVVGWRDPTGELEKPHGQWNFVELVADKDTVKHYVNGRLANEGKDASPAAGKILFQSEGAEVYFRNIKLYPLTARAE